ncbi:hypothetical protein GQ42DRAFT_156730 [Ramicandelaber brevisporus]|nr:hypothetical protein GQ42DRAFT_156730 [Ramicandelaber brevisporus]
MQRLAGLYKSLVARVKGRFRPLPANSPLSTADGPLLTTPSAPFQIPSQTECLLLRLPPELLRLCWQYTDATDPWRHRTVCRLLYDILTDLAWRDKLPWFFTMRQWAAPNRELLGQFGYLTRGFTTPRLFEQWPRPSEWPVMLPNLTSFTIDMHVSAIKTVLKEIFDDCVAKLPLLMHLELKLGAYSLNDNSNLVEGVKNLVSWINDGTLPNLKSVGMSFPAGDLQKLQLFANCVELLRPVRHRIKLRIKLKSHMLNTSGKRAVDDVAFQDFADALEALDLNSWSVRDCLSIINENIIIHPSGNAVSFSHLRELKIYVCNCTTGDYSQWQPSVFPSLQAMRVNIYTSACRDSASHQTAFSDSSSASSIFAHSWPKVRAFELDGPILLATANRVLACFPIASIVTVKQIVPSEQPDILVYADKLASSLRYARHVHLAGFGNSGTPSAPIRHKSSSVPHQSVA